MTSSQGPPVRARREERAHRTGRICGGDALTPRPAQRSCCFPSYEPPRAPTDHRPVPDCAHLHTERHKPGVTLELLHLEYLEQHPDGYRYTQFREVYPAVALPPGPVDVPGRPSRRQSDSSIARGRSPGTSRPRPGR